MLGFLATASGLGIYKVSLTFAILVSLPLNALNRIFPPIVSGLYEKDNRHDLVLVYKTVTRWAVTGGLPISIGLIFFREQFLQLMGPGFTEGGLILSILIVGQFVNTAVGPSGYLLLMTDRQNLVMINQWVFGILNVVLNFLLISKIGTIGAAIATAITLILLNSIRVFEVSLLEGYHPFTKTLIKPVVASCGLILSLFLVEPISTGIIKIVIGAAIGGTVYVGVLASLGVSSTDLMVYNRIRDER
jgi:O-antigen/teichoic acid export membrane protein